MTKRTFMIIGAFTNKGCPTKFNKNGKYIGSTPSSATKKAFTELCRIKNIRGVATYYIRIKETTKDSSQKVFEYLLHRNKLKKPIVRFKGTDKEFTIRYSNSIKASSVPKKRICKTKRKLTRQRGGANSNNNIDKTERCMVCIDRCPNIQMLDCNHWICKVCYENLTTPKRCPKCRNAFDETKEYLPFVECSKEREKEMEKENIDLRKRNNNCNKTVSKLTKSKVQLTNERNALEKAVIMEKKKKKKYKQLLINCRDNMEELTNDVLQNNKSSKKRKKR